MRGTVPPRYASGVSEPKRGTDPVGDFAEIWDSERRNASYLRVVTGGLLVLLLALSTGWCRSASRTLQPVFVRVDEIGRAEALDYAALTWQNDPLHPSTKYFLPSSSPTTTRGGSRRSGSAGRIRWRSWSAAWPPRPPKPTSRRSRNSRPE